MTSFESFYEYIHFLNLQNFFWFLLKELYIAIQLFLEIFGFTIDIYHRFSPHVWNRFSVSMKDTNVYVYKVLLS